MQPGLDKQYASVSAMIPVFSPGWNTAAVALRLTEIHRFVLFNTRAVALGHQRKIAGLSRNLLAELRGLGGLQSGTLDDLQALASRATGAAGRGRKPGHFSIESSVRRMAVRLYIEACAAPGFSASGPLFRFANAVRRLTLDDGKSFTSDAIGAEFTSMKRTVRKPKRLVLGAAVQEDVSDRIAGLRAARFHARKSWT